MKHPDYKAAIATLQQWRKVGQTFLYFGITMKVVSHTKLCTAGTTGAFGRPMVWEEPSLRARYVDKNGQLHEVVFGIGEFEYLVESQPQPGQWQSVRT